MITCEAGRASEPSISSETGESSVSGESGGACIQARSSNRHGKKYEMRSQLRSQKPGRLFLTAGVWLFAPVKPVKPVAPVNPVNPVKPVSPVKPVKPAQFKKDIRGHFVGVGFATGIFLHARAYLHACHFC